MYTALSGARWFIDGILRVYEVDCIGPESRICMSPYFLLTSSVRLLF